MNEWLDDLKTATAFLTRLPMPHPQGPMPQNFVRAHRMFPLVGAAIGGAAGLVCLGLRAIGVPDLAAAALAAAGLRSRGGARFGEWSEQWGREGAGIVDDSARRSAAPTFRAN